LETAKEILAEVFHTHPADVEEMIQLRLEERDWKEEESEEGLWPATFCLNQYSWEEASSSRGWAS
jgi:hypothetical protein